MIRHTNILLFIILFALINVKNICAQELNLDSLHAIWQDKSYPDSLSVNSYVDYIWGGFIYYKPDTAKILADDLYRFSVKENSTFAAVKSFDMLGEINFWRGNFPLALEYGQKSKDLYLKMGDKQGVLNSLTSIVKIYASQGNSLQALVYLQQSIKIFEEIGDKLQTSVSNVEMDILYDYERDIKLKNPVVKVKEFFITDIIPEI